MNSLNPISVASIFELCISSPSGLNDEAPCLLFYRTLSLSWNFVDKKFKSSKTSVSSTDIIYKTRAYLEIFHTLQYKVYTFIAASENSNPLVN